jgi:PKD repeat protein
MKRRKRLFISFFISIIIFCSIFVVAIEYELLGGATIENDKPSLLVRIFTDEKSGTIPFKVNFSSLVLYHTGNIKYLWDFGDNATSNEIYPLHIYEQTGVYECTLTVTDSVGKQSSDKVEIIVRDNEAPIVSITLSDLRPNRPFIPIFRHKMISIDYEGKNFRRIIESGLFPKFLLNIEGFVSCEATALSPEGNEIISYRWELRPPTYNKIRGQQKKPKYNFEGKNVTIPLFYTYPQAEYDLTVIVTDSKGLVGTNTIKFEVQLNEYEDKILSNKRTLKDFRRYVWHDILKTSYGETTGNIIFDFIIPLFPGLSIPKLLLILVLAVNWDLEPNEGVIADILARFFNKRQNIGNLVGNVFNKIISLLNKRNPKYPIVGTIIDKIIDKLETMLESWDLQNNRPILLNETPADGSKHLNTNIPEVAITVEDPEGDSFNITIHGKFVNNISLFNQYNNTFIAKLKTPLPNLTDIYWHVNVSYSKNKWVNASYKFSTW